MDEPTALFDSYQHDFNQLINEVRQNLDGDSSGGKDGQSNITLNTLTTKKLTHLRTDV